MKRITMLLFISLAAAPLLAVDYTRSLNQDGTWFQAGAWVPGGDWINPTGSETASAAITTVGATPLSLTLDQPVFLNSFSLAGAADLTLAGQLLTFNSPPAWSVATGRKLTFAAPVKMIGGTTLTVPAGATIAFTGDSVITNTLASGNGTLVFSSGTTVINGGTGGSSSGLALSGVNGSIYFTGDAVVDVTAGNAPINVLAENNNASGKKGTFYLDGNAKLITRGGAFYLGVSASNSKGDFVQDGGEVTHYGSSFRLGWNSSGSANVESVYTLKSGKLNIPNCALQLGRSGHGTFLMEGGEAIAKGMGITFTSAGGGGSKGRAELLGGRFTVSGDGNITATHPAVATLKLGPTTLATTAVNSFSITSLNSAQLVDAQDGTVFDPATNQTITVSVPLVDSGRLVLGGDGTLQLNAANTYTGGTEIRKGILSLTAADAFPANTPLTLNAPGQIRINAAGSMTLSPSSFTLNGGAIAMRLSLAAADRFETGALTLGTGETTFNLTFTGAPVGNYTLIQSATAIVNPENIANLKTGPLPEDTRAEFSIQDNALVLTMISTKSLAWNADCSTWATNSTDQLSDVAHPGNTRAYTDEYGVIFPNLAGASSATVSVQGTVAPLFMSMPNSETAYTFDNGGEGAIAFDPAVGFATSVNGRPVTISVPMTMTKSLTVGENSTLTFTDVFGANASSAVTGAAYSGALSVNDNATLTLSAAGKTQTISTDFAGSGILAIDNGANVSMTVASKKFTGQVQVADATLTLNVKEFIQNTHYLNENTYFFLIRNGGRINAVVSSVNSENANLYGFNFAQLETGATLAHTSNDLAFRGKLLFTGSATLLNDGGYGWKTFPPAVFKATAGKTEFKWGGIDNSGHRLQLGSGGTTQGWVTFDIDSGAEITFMPSFDLLDLNVPVNNGVTKIGGGTLSFQAGAGKITTILPFSIAGGRVVIDRVSNGSGTYTVESTATLAGAGSITGTGLVTVKNGGTIETGLTVKDLTLDAGSQIAVAPVTRATQASAKGLTVTGTLTAPAALVVDTSSIGLDVYRKVCDVLVWGAAPPPATTFTLNGPNADKFFLKQTERALELHRQAGIMITVF